MIEVMTAPAGGTRRDSKRARTRGNRSPALQQFWVVVTLLCVLLWGGGIIRRLIPPYPYLHDFVQEWTSARNFLEGKPVYGDLGASIEHHFQGRYRAGVMEVNAHPPASVLAVVPFALTDYTVSYLAWTVVSLIMLLISVAVIVRRLEFSAWMLLPITTFLVTSNALAQQINQGQLNLLLLLLITLAWAADRDDRQIAGGLWIGVAGGIKLFPAFLLLYFAAQRKWLAVGSALLAIVALNGVTVLVLGWDTFAAYLFDVLPKVSAFRDYWANASAAGFWSRLFDPHSGHVLPLWENPLLAKVATLATQLLITLAVGVVSWQATTRPRRDRAFALAIIGMLLVSPITWDHYFLLLVLPWLLLWKISSDQVIDRMLIILFVVALGFVYPKWIWDATIPGPGELSPLPDVVPSVAQPVHALTVLAFPFYGLLLLFLFTMTRRLTPVAAE